jgi:hypothetical protein
MIVTDEFERMWKEAVVSYLMKYPSIYLDRLKKTKKNIIEDTKALNKNSNPKPPEYKDE